MTSVRLANSHLLWMLDPQQIKACCQGSRGDFAKRQPACARGLLALKHRAVFVKSAEPRRQIVEIAAQVMRFQIAGHDFNHFAQTLDVPGERKLVLSLEPNLCRASLTGS